MDSNLKDNIEWLKKVESILSNDVKGKFDFSNRRKIIINCIKDRNLYLPKNTSSDDVKKHLDIILGSEIELLKSELALLNENIKGVPFHRKVGDIIRFDFTGLISNLNSQIYSIQKLINNKDAHYWVLNKKVVNGVINDDMLILLTNLFSSISEEEAYRSKYIESLYHHKDVIFNILLEELKKVDERSEEDAKKEAELIKQSENRKNKNRIFAGTRLTLRLGILVFAGHFIISSISSWVDSRAKLFKDVNRIELFSKALNDHGIKDPSFALAIERGLQEYNYAMKKMTKPVSKGSIDNDYDVLLDEAAQTVYDDYKKIIVEVINDEGLQNNILEFINDPELGLTEEKKSKIKNNLQKSFSDVNFDNLFKQLLDKGSIKYLIKDYLNNYYRETVSKSSRPGIKAIIESMSKGDWKSVWTSLKWGGATPEPTLKGQEIVRRNIDKALIPVIDNLKNQFKEYIKKSIRNYFEERKHIIKDILLNKKSISEAAEEIFKSDLKIAGFSLLGLFGIFVILNLLGLGVIIKFPLNQLKKAFDDFKIVIKGE